MLMVFASMIGVAMACPGAYSSAPCDGGGSNDVCVLTGGDTIWQCALDINGDSTSATAYVVYNTGYGADYSAWGETAEGTGAGYEFCCQTNGLNSGTHVRTIKLMGGSYDDSLYFTYSTFDLGTHSATEGALTGKLYGRDGEDSISGSKEGDVDIFIEYLYGEGGNDSIVANAGDDTVLGGPGIDEIDGNSGIDDIDGGGGDVSTLRTVVVRRSATCDLNVPAATPGA